MSKVLTSLQAQCGVCAIFYILRLAARGKCQNAKRFMLIFTQAGDAGGGKRPTDIHIKWKTFTVFSSLSSTECRKMFV